MEKPLDDVMRTIRRRMKEGELDASIPSTLFATFPVSGGPPGHFGRILRPSRRFATMAPEPVKGAREVRHPCRH